ncbi:MAG: phosphoribosyl-AMP cyclohydrolase [Planctomycetota bacterium]|nr:phosphoribosyl-AMP cyclohydrolase [Planctomycetota bacterium]
MTNGPDFLKGMDGLLPAIAQDAQTLQVLMMAWMNLEAYQETLASGYATYYSRSRKKLWRKGEESGHRQRVVQVRVDCDADCILVLVDQTGAACHEGYANCFFRQATPEGLIVDQVRLVDPESVYKKRQAPVRQDSVRQDSGRQDSGLLPE